MFTAPERTLGPLVQLLGDIPPRVECSLTAAGEELVPVMESMCGWGKHLGVAPKWPREAPVAV